MDLNLRTYAFDLIEQAKQNLRQDGCLFPVAFIVTPETILVSGVRFETPEEKQEAYQAVIEAARQHLALAIITLNDAHYGRPAPGQTASHVPGRLAAEGAPECIFLSVSGPDITTWSVTVPYKRPADGIAFEPPEEFEGGDFNLLPGWSSSGGART